jgi:hypothetical protein
MIEFICGDCGFIGDTYEFFNVPENAHQGESKLAVRYAISNKMKYMGCSDCQSPNLYFNINNMESSEDILFDQNEISEIVESKKKKTINQKENKEIEVKSDKEKHSYTPQIAPPGQIVNSAFEGFIQGSVLLENQRVVPEEVDIAKISDNNIVIGDINKYPKRPKRRFKKKCNDCGSNFETKHQDIRLCSRCLQGLTRRRS